MDRYIDYNQWYVYLIYNLDEIYIYIYMTDLGTDAQLAAALSGTQLINAAEIIRYTYSGWSSDSIEKFEKMILNIFYPPASQTTPTPDQKYPL